MATPISIDLAQIAWTSGNITRFEVTGNYGAKQLLQEDPTTAIAVVHRADLGHDIKEGKAAVFLYIELSITSGNSAQPNGISGRFEIDFTFAIGNLAELVVDREGSDSLLHPQLVLMLTSVAYSTARGILWTRLAGTPLEGITLPLVNPAQLLQPASPAVIPPAAGKKPRASLARPKKSKPAQ